MIGFCPSRINGASLLLRQARAAAERGLQGGQKRSYTAEQSRFPARPTLWVPFPPGFVVGRHSRAIILCNLASVRHTATIFRHTATIFRHSATIFRHSATIFSHTATIFRHPAVIRTAPRVHRERAICIGESDLAQRRSASRLSPQTGPVAGPEIQQSGHLVMQSFQQRPAVGQSGGRLHPPEVQG